MTIFYISTETKFLSLDIDEEYGHSEFVLYKKGTKAPFMFSSFREAELAIERVKLYRDKEHKELTLNNIHSFELA